MAADVRMEKTPWGVDLPPAFHGGPHCKVTRLKKISQEWQQEPNPKNTCLEGTGS